MEISRRGKLIIALLLIYLWIMAGWAMYLEGGQKKDERKTSQTITQEYRKPAIHSAAEPAKSRSTGISNRAGSGYVSRGLGYGLRYKDNFIVTAYCPCEKCTGKNVGDPGYKEVAISTPRQPKLAQEGRTVAADWEVLPPGTEIKIEGLQGTYTVEDRGGAIKGRRLDLYFNLHNDARAWGKQTHKVWIVRRLVNETQAN